MIPETGLLLLHSFVQGLGWELSDRQISQFDRYLLLLLTWNTKINLTAITDPVDIIIRHFCDSLSCIAVTGSLDRKRLIDVGSGAGFPGVPMSIMFPETRLTLVESVRKKSDFLKTLVEELGLTDVQILNQRAEVIGQSKEFRERYDIAIARAVAQATVLVEYLLPLVALGGTAIAMKGRGAVQEIENAEGAISTLGGGTPQIHRADLPRVAGDPSASSQTTSQHFLVVIKKIGLTPQKYPRRAGMPAKRPLGMI